GSILATENEKMSAKIPDLHETDIELVESEIDKINGQLAPLTHFILPGGHKEVAFCHIARTVCRRAERLVVELNEKEPVDALIIKYINRLSDYLFMLCRIMTKDMNADEVIWRPRK
ncbi:MAG: cob(I)yrinic acid a,c-diamide adenosyltransferase, partial [Cytophagales bacterium]